MGISGLSILFDLLWYVLVFGAAAVVAKWMIELHWTRAHTEYVTELLDCGRLSISERCSRAKTAVASIPEWIATEFNAARRYMAGNMMSVLCLLCVAMPLLLGIAYVKFTPGPLAELIPVGCVDGSEDSELPDYVLAEYEFTEPATCYYAEYWEYGQVQAQTTVEAACCFASNDHISWHRADGHDCTAEFIPAIQTEATTTASRRSYVKIEEKIKHGILNISWAAVKYSRHPAAYNGQVHDEAATFAKNSDVFDADTLVGKYVCRKIADKCRGSHSLCTVEYPEPSTDNETASDGTEDSGERFMHTIKSISPWKVCQCDEHKKSRQMKYACRGWRPRDDGTRELTGDGFCKICARKADLEKAAAAKPAARASSGVSYDGSPASQRRLQSGVNRILTQAVAAAGGQNADGSLMNPDNMKQLIQGLLEKDIIAASTDIGMMIKDFPAMEQIIRNVATTFYNARQPVPRSVQKPMNDSSPT